MNPFRAINCGHTGYSTPLNPLKHDKHELYYAPVDNTKIAYDVYIEYLEKFDSIPTKHAILFHGETGCGKTSLMNRCLKYVSAVEWQKEDDRISPYIIDTRSENMGAKSAVKHNKEYKLYYQKKQLEGKPHYLIMNNISNKMLRTIYSVVKNKTLYSQDYICLDPRERNINSSTKKVA